MKRNPIFGLGMLAFGVLLGGLGANVPFASAAAEDVRTPHLPYLEIVTRDVDGVVAAYSSALDLAFSEPVAALGGARTATMAGEGLLGVRAPLRPDENPIVRPYWLVPDIPEAVESAVRAGGQVAHPPLEIPGHGWFAIYYLGGNDHGFWQY